MAENIDIKQLMDGETPFYPQTDIHGLVNNGEYAIDDVPTIDSSNLITSSGVASELALGAVYDVTAHNGSAQFASLQALLTDPNLNTLIPTNIRRGGMSIKFVSDNKFLQYRYMESDATTTATFTNVANWQGVDDEPLDDSENLVKSGGVANSLISLADNLLELNDNDTDVQEITPEGTFKGYLKSNGTWGNTGETSSFNTDYYQVKKGEILKIYHIGGTTNAKYGFFLNVPSSSVLPNSYKSNTDDTTKDIIIAPEDGYITLSNSYENNRKCYKLSSVQTLIDTALQEILEYYNEITESIINTGYIRGKNGLSTLKGSISKYGSPDFHTNCFLLEGGKNYRIICNDLSAAYNASGNSSFLVGYGLNNQIPNSDGPIDYYFDMYQNNIDNVVITPENDTYLLVNNHLIDYFKVKEVTNTTIDELENRIALLEHEESELHRYFNKTCIYIGDSISTKNNYQWKGLLEEAYNFKYVRDISGQLAPASGGIHIIPLEDESEVTLHDKSIWYRCAENRMSIYNFDVISLFGGTNDMTNENLVIGTENDIPYVDDTSSFAEDTVTDVWSENLTFAQCFMGCIEMLKRDFPTKEIVICTIMPCGGTIGNWTDPVTGLTASEAIANLQARIANKYELKVVPFYWNVRTAENANNRTFSKDTVHPNLPCALRMRAAFAEILCL